MMMALGVIYQITGKLIRQCNMFIKGNMIYSEAGYILKCDNKKAFQLPYNASKEYIEIPINITNTKIESGMINMDGVVFRNNKKYDYGQWKANIIKKRYSNDDQIAILLNKDDSAEDKMRYDKMQEWREYASALAKKFVELNELS